MGNADHAGFPRALLGISLGRMRAPRSLGTILLLALALVLVGVLVFQAQDAARSQQRIAESTLKDYASFADWQLTQQATSSVLSSVITSLSAQASRVDPRRLNATMLSPEQAEAAAREITEPLLPWVVTRTPTRARTSASLQPVLLEMSAAS